MGPSYLRLGHWVNIQLRVSCETIWKPFVKRCLVYRISESGLGEAIHIFSTILFFFVSFCLVEEIVENRCF